MATLTVYSGLDGNVDGGSGWSAVPYGTGTYAYARTGSTAGGGAVSVNTTNTTLRIGQSDTVDGTQGHYWQCFEGFFDFDTSALPDDAVISAATFQLYGVGGAAATKTYEVRYQDFGGTLEAADYVSGASLSGLTTGGTFSTTSGGAFTPTVALANLANISKTGSTRFIAFAQDHMNNVTPASGADERAWVYSSEQSGTTEDPALTITYTQPPSAPGAFTFPAAGGSYPAGSTIAVAWGAATDSDTTASLLVYEVGYWNGSSWTVLTTTGANVLTYNWNTSGLPGRTDYQLRVRAKDPDNNFGSYTTLGAFTLTAGMHMLL